MWGVFAKPFRNIERIFPTKQEAVSRMVDLCKTMPNIKRITIFGSAVTAGCNPWSDIDIYFETDTPLRTYPVVLGDDVFDNWSNFTAEVIVVIVELELWKNIVYLLIHEFVEECEFCAVFLH